MFFLWLATLGFEGRFVIERVRQMGNGFKKPVPAAQIKDQRLAEKVAAEKPPELTGNLEADLKLLRSGGAPVSVTYSGRIGAGLSLY
jgi:hypothetical protein